MWVDFFNAISEARERLRYYLCRSLILFLSNYFGVFDFTSVEMDLIEFAENCICSLRAPLRKYASLLEFADISVHYRVTSNSTSQST